MLREVERAIRSANFILGEKKRHLQCPLNWQVNPLKNGYSTSELLTGGLLQTQPANHPAIFVPQLTDKRPPAGGGKRIWWLISVEPDSATLRSVIGQENCQRLNRVTESGYDIKLGIKISRSLLQGKPRNPELTISQTQQEGMQLQPKHSALVATATSARTNPVRKVC